MNYYYLLLIIIFIFTWIWALFKGTEDIKKNPKYLFFVFMILTFFISFRSINVGVDAQSYKEIFYDISKCNFLDVYNYDRYEVGYKYLCKIFSLVWNNYQFFLSSVSIFQMIAVYNFIKNNSKNYAISSFIFITFETYIFFFGILRQGLALAILLFSIKYLKENKVFKFIILVLIASLFHKTAGVFIIAYPLKYLKINKISIIIFSVLCFITLLFGKEIINFILSFIYKPASIKFNSGEGYKLLLLMYSICIIGYILKNKLILQNKNNILFLEILMLGTLIQCLSPTFKNVGRLVIYFFPFIDILLANIFEVIECKKYKIALFCLMIISLSMFYYIRTDDLFYELFF